MYPSQPTPQPAPQPAVQPNLEFVAKKPTFQVSLPVREIVSWPPNCIQCGSFLRLRDHIVTASFKSGEYGIAKQTTTQSFSGSKICKSCATKQARFWLILIGGGLVFSVAFGIFWYLQWSIPIFEAVCVAGVILVAIIILGAMVHYFIGEAPPVEVEIQTEAKIIGSIRPVRYDFIFRNKKYAFEFAKANGLMSNHNCDRCGLQMLTDASRNYEYCLSCNTVMD